MHCTGLSALMLGPRLISLNLFANPVAKGVTTVFDYSLRETGVHEPPFRLQQSCRTGGTAKAEWIEFQGERLKRFDSALRGVGVWIKHVGGRATTVWAVRVSPRANR